MFDVVTLSDWVCRVSDAVISYVRPMPAKNMTKALCSQLRLFSTNANTKHTYTHTHTHRERDTHTHTHTHTHTLVDWHLSSWA